MSEPMKKTSCQIACLAMGAAAGFVAFIMLMTLGGWGFIQAVFGAALVFVVLGGVLSWILCRPLPALGEIKAGMAEVDATPAPKAAEVSATVAATPAVAVTPLTAQPVSSPKAQEAVAEVKSGTLLEGENELAARAPKAKPASKAKTSSASAAVAPATSDEGLKPATLSAPQGGQADNLKEIKGIGPKLEAMLHEMGFFHFFQIADWTTAELAWVDDNLSGFKGRASRDNWVEQAKTLANGGETEFSKRVDGGDVY